MKSTYESAAEPAAEEKKEEPKEEKKKGKKGKKGKKADGGGGGDAASAAPVAADAAAALAALGDVAEDEKYEMVDEEYEEEVDAPSNFELGAFGEIKSGAMDRSIKDYKMKTLDEFKKKFKSGANIDKFIKDDTKKHCEPKAAPFNKFKSEVEKYMKAKGDVEEQHYQKGAKIMERVPAFELAAGLILKDDEMDFGGNKFIGVLSFIEEMMGWTGNDARNPTLCKFALQTLTHALSHIPPDAKKTHPGYFMTYCEWLAKALTEKKFSKDASKLAMASAQHFGPKVVVSRLLERAILEKTDKNWAGIMQSCADIVEAFGVHNCMPVHIFKYTSELMKKAKKEGKDPTYKVKFLFFPVEYEFEFEFFAMNILFLSA